MVADSQAGTLAPDAVTGGYLDCAVMMNHVRFGLVAAAVVVVALVVVAAACSAASPATTCG